MRKDFFEPLRDMKIDMQIISGNHDIYYKNSNEVNALDELLTDNEFVHIINKPITMNMGGTAMLFLPWICDDNMNECMEAINKTPAQILFAHLELKGFEMHKGTYAEHGFSTDIFEKFDVVCSGHFHHKSSYQNINYLGNPWQTSWSDYGDTKGFHLFDLSTRELQFVENPYKLFNKLHYNDLDKSYEDVVNVDISALAGTYVKLIVSEKQNPYWFDKLVQRLEELPVLDVTVVEDHFNLNLDDGEIIDQAESTLEILSKSIKNLGIKAEYEKPLENLLRTLYSEANLMQA
jgi:DNA repair exonuclease SbcCD nuclease subunit